MNPAVSLAMVILGKLPLKKFPVYVVAQFLGAFAGSCAVYGLYYGGFNDILYCHHQSLTKKESLVMWITNPGKVCHKTEILNELLIMMME